ncbi:Alcohol dehydrogenase iron-containing [sediment metagenome]|uniref:Alcohol dehydrogenase iron-containing n=1 Tax=sediment metagenome TaxID=749907 RepID=D9PJ33_9ZZZZ
MVKPFQFARFPDIYFKNGKLSDLSGFIKKYGNTIILVTGKKSFIQSDQAINLFDSFKKSGIKYHHIIVIGEPSPELIDESVLKLNDQPIQLVVGIGGGSVIDAGKAISAMMFKTGSVKDYLEGVGTKEHPGTKLPFIAVPTTSGTGSEATKNAVISHIGINGFKKSLRHDNLVPDIAIIDPELTLNCPKDITAASGMDCFTQLTEAYLSDKSSPFTDALALEGLKAVKSSLVKSFTDGHDITARAGMSFAALTSGICLANAGLGVVHGFASSIGGMYSVPHGLVCGTLMSSANEINVRELRKKDPAAVALKKYSLLGKLFLDEEGKSDDYFIDGFIQYLKKLTFELQLPGLKDFGLREKDSELICSITENKNNPVKLTMENLMEILIKRI